MSAAVRQPFTVKGRHVLFGVLGFFTVVIGLDSLFVVWAVRSFPGEVSSRAYEDGLAYNQAIAARRAQASLGWSAKVAQGARPGEVSVALADAAGKPIEGLTVTARFTRPATEQGALDTTLRASTTPGTYAGAGAAEPGAWDLHLTATNRDGQRFEAERRLVWR